jgi:poly-gamma-glutamate synthesis protein (capsule biosynthesis protein)
MRSVDLRIVNLECAITSNKEPWARTPKTFHFRADPSAAAVLRAARIDACSLANDHVLDYEEGLLDTLAHLDDAGIAYAGAGRNPQKATLDRMEALSAEMGTVLGRRDDCLVLEP